MAGKDAATYVEATSTPEQIAQAREALDELVRIVARTIADTCERSGIAVDMDDPKVPREVISATLEALLLSPGKKKGAAARRT